MDWERKISGVNWAVYTNAARILDQMWGLARREPVDPALVKRIAGQLYKWRSSINKMRRNSLSDRPVIEGINLSRCVKDIDSLLWRLGKITPLAQVRVNDDSESQEESVDGD